jgi:hypothetical protein
VQAVTIAVRVTEANQFQSWPRNSFVPSFGDCGLTPEAIGSKPICLREDTQKRPEDRMFVFVPACSGTPLDPPPLACGRRPWHHGLAAVCLHMLCGATSQAAKRTTLRSRGCDTTRAKHAFKLVA